MAMGKKQILCAATLGVVGLFSARAGAELIYATNGTTISRFDSGSLGTVTTSAAVTGLQAGETLVDIDVRPNPTSPGVQALYGVGSTSRVYTINPTTGVATAVGASAFSPGLNGTAFGVDFNPVPDRIRLVSNTEQNARLNPDTGARADTPTADTSLTPAGNVVSVAYDRNYPRLTGDSTPTTLYGIDSAAGTLVTVGGVNGSPSPNLGAITTVGSLGLGTNLNEAIGFDISGVTANGVAAGPSNLPIGTAYASITTGGISRLYTINLTTGAATLVSSNAGAIGTGTTPFVGLASAVAPEPGSVGLLGVAAAFGLIRRRRAARRG